ncbi:hypothetical protein AB6O49_34590 [Streptomyces sp. SBR177]
MPATQQLRIAVETLHVKAGSPAPQDLAVASRWNLGINETAALLEGEVLPDEHVLRVFVRLLGGDIPYFMNLLADARGEAGSAASAQARADEDQPSAGGSADETPASSVDQVLETFSNVFIAQDTVQDARARILRKRGEEKQDDEPEPHALLVHKLTSMRTRAADLARRTTTRPTWA